MRFNLPLAVLSAAAATTFALPTLSAQDPKPGRTTEPTTTVWPGYSLVWSGSSNRAVLGVTLTASSPADTAGVRLDAVDSGGPAAKAGLKSGDVITEINGVNLRVSPADAEDLALGGIAQRRLQRTLAKAKPGDEVDLRVRTGTAAPRAVKVKTVSAAELDGARLTATSRVRTSANDNDAAIGVSISASGNHRDTLGLFVASVISEGPADKAGLIEGERIAAVNGVDLRIPKEDFEDMSATSARVNRFTREVQKVAPGGTVNLRVYANGRYREVAVKAVKRSELPSSGMSISIGDGGVHFFNRGMVTPMPSIIGRTGPGGMMVRPPQVRIRADDHGFEYQGAEFEKAMEQLRVRMQELGRNMNNLKIELKGTGARRAITSI